MTDNRMTELQKKLKEAGVKYTHRTQGRKTYTNWGEPMVNGAQFIDGGDWTELTVENATPDQAIATTLGSGTLTADDVLNAVYNHGARWQAIADELNTKLGGGNCARCAEDMGRYADSLCDPLKERIAELLRCLENDWHIHASWDGLRKFWCVELTEEGVKLRDATHGTLTAEQVREAIERHSAWVIGKNRCFHDGAYEEIADELNAELGSGTCKITATATNNLMYPDYMTKWYELSCGHSLTLKGDEAPRWCAVCGKAVEQ